MMAPILAPVFCLRHVTPTIKRIPIPTTTGMDGSSVRAAVAIGPREDGRMTDLGLLRHREWWGTQTEVLDIDPDTLAQVAFSIVAMTLAEPLRRAFHAHLDEHGCGTGDTASPRYVGGFIHCSRARELWDMLPGGDRIVIG